MRDFKSTFEKNIFRLKTRGKYYTKVGCQTKIAVKRCNIPYLRNLKGLFWECRFDLVRDFVRSCGGRSETIRSSCIGVEMSRTDTSRFETGSLHEHENHGWMHYRPFFYQNIPNANVLFYMWKPGRFMITFSVVSVVESKIQNKVKLTCKAWTNNTK